MNITLIAAIGKNRELGKNNGLIWYIPEDLKFFKENTTGKKIIMGMNTLKSLPRLLPNRKHIVLTHQEVDLDPQIEVMHSLDELLNYISSLGEEEVMVIGGGQVYSLMMEYADKLLITEIDKEYDADVYFPEITTSSWDKEVLSNHQHEDLEYSHVVYTRKKVLK